MAMWPCCSGPAVTTPAEESHALLPRGPWDARYLVLQDGFDVLLHQDQQRRGRAEEETYEGLLSSGPVHSGPSLLQSHSLGEKSLCSAGGQ